MKKDYTKYIADEPSREEQVVSEYQSGKPLKAISKKFELSMGKIYTILYSSGIATRRDRKALTEVVDSLDTEQVMELLADYEAGMPLLELRDKYSLHKNGVYYLLDSYEVPRRRNRNAKKGEGETI